MSIFASIAIVCTMATCSDYIVDHASTMQDAKARTQVIDNAFLADWGDEQKLNQWLDKYQIGETVFEIVSIEFETKEVKEDEIP
jgi:hypothetical protein